MLYGFAIGHSLINAAVAVAHQQNFPLELAGALLLDVNILAGVNCGGIAIAAGLAGIGGSTGAVSVDDPGAFAGGLEELGLVHFLVVPLAGGGCAVAVVGPGRTGVLGNNAAQAVSLLDLKGAVAHQHNSPDDLEVAAVFLIGVLTGLDAVAGRGVGIIILGGAGAVGALDPGAFASGLEEIRLVDFLVVPLTGGKGVAVVGPAGAGVDDHVAAHAVDFGDLERAVGIQLDGPLDGEAAVVFLKLIDLLFCLGCIGVFHFGAGGSIGFDVLGAAGSKAQDEGQGQNNA